MILHALARRVATRFGERLPVDDADLERLRALAGGTTVAQLADDNGFSEREMFRILSDLYESIGVKNRTEAIVWAARYGVLDEPGPTAI
jgi:DNA-binding NarL/FixJ family response regulator